MIDLEHITPDEVRDHAIARFKAKAAEKYDKGQAEHGGLIVDRDLLNEIEDEAIDLVFYIFALRLNLQRAEARMIKQNAKLVCRWCGEPFCECKGDDE